MKLFEDEVRSRPGSFARVNGEASVASSTVRSGLESQRQQQRPLATVRSEQLVIAVASISGNTARGSAPALCEHCGRKHFGQCWRITGACLRCGSHDHFQKDCPMLKITAVQQSEGLAPTLSQKRKSSQIGVDVSRLTEAAESSG
ncbi:hypothetical protein ACOSQ3_028045 [Xanthoceras sorbifolium]